MRLRVSVGDLAQGGKQLMQINAGLKHRAHIEVFLVSVVASGSTWRFHLPNNESDILCIANRCTLWVISGKHRISKMGTSS